MRRAVVVCSWSGGKEYTSNCLRHLEGLRYPIIVVMNDASNASQEWIDKLQRNFHVLPVFENRFELGAIQAIYDQTDIDEFWLIQHSVEILDQTVFDIGFTYKDKSISYAYNQFENYLGKYIRKTLDKIEIPKAYTKWHALYYESVFNNLYTRAESGDGTISCIDSRFYNDNPDNYIDDRFGEKRFVEVGKYLKKYRNLDPKSHNIPNWWSPEAFNQFIDFFGEKKEDV